MSRVFHSGVVVGIRKRRSDAAKQDELRIDGNFVENGGVSLGIIRRRSRTEARVHFGPLLAVALAFELHATVGAPTLVEMDGDRAHRCINAMFTAADAVKQAHLLAKGGLVLIGASFLLRPHGGPRHWLFGMPNNVEYILSVGDAHG